MASLDLQRGTYAAADTLLGSRPSRRIGHNTTLRRCSYQVEPRTLAVRYHSTDIVTLTPDGWLTLSTGGWHTVTTWQRINALLPGPWGVHSDRGTPWLYYSGRKVTPYADGLAVHPETGAVGMSGAVLLTADDIAAIIDAADIAAAARADRRAARLLREHPEAFGPRTHSRAAYDRRVYGCARCDAELAAERAARQAVLHAEHVAMSDALSRATDAAPWTDAEYGAAGSHVTREEVRTHPPLPGAQYPEWQRDYSVPPVISERVKVACPWECPDRPRSW